MVVVNLLSQLLISGQKQQKNDWNNGSIAGVKADAKLEVNAKHQQTATNAGVNATQDTVVVKGVKISY